MTQTLASTFVVMSLLATLGGCNTPSEDFRGIPAQQIAVGPSTFDVRRNGDEVELIRTSPEAVFTLRDLAPRAAEAVRLATGCALISESLTGEATLMRGVIDCDANGGPDQFN